MRLAAPLDRGPPYLGPPGSFQAASCTTCVPSTPLEYAKTIPLAMTVSSARSMSRDSQAGVSCHLPATSSSLSAAMPPPLGRLCSIGALNCVLTGPQNGTSTHCVPWGSCQAPRAPQTPTLSNAWESAQISGVV